MQPLSLRTLHPKGTYVCSVRFLVGRPHTYYSYICSYTCIYYFYTHTSCSYSRHWRFSLPLVGGQSARVRWSPVASANGYVIYIQSAGGETRTERVSLCCEQNMPTFMQQCGYTQGFAIIIDTMLVCCSHYPIQLPPCSILLPLPFLQTS